MTESSKDGKKPAARAPATDTPPPARPVVGRAPLDDASRAAPTGSAPAPGVDGRPLPVAGASDATATGGAPSPANRAYGHGMAGTVDPATSRGGAGAGKGAATRRGTAERAARGSTAPTGTRLRMRTPVAVGALATLLLVGGFGSWAALTEVSGAIIAPGQIEVERNRQIVQHRDGGIVEEILVDEGDSVAQDQLLLRLDPSDLRTELTIVENQIFELMARRGRLEAERLGSDEISFDPELLDRAAGHDDIRDLVEGQERLFEARGESIERETEQLQRRAAQISNQIEGIEAQQSALSRQLELIERELVGQQSLLDRGLAQSSRVLSLEREQARLSGQMGELTAQMAQSEGRITEIDLEILKLDTQRREDAITRLRDLRFRELELAEQRLALRKQLARMELRAPVGGIVYGMQVTTPRSVLKAADPVMFIIPQDRPLVIVAQVDPIDIDQIRVGQEVTLRFSALNQRTTPELFGTVRLVSPDAFTDDDTRQSYYRIEIVLPEEQQARLPDTVTLVPGMPVESFIQTEARTPVTYLVKPLTDYFAKAFRES